jgi:hypothetical protein
MLDINNMPYLVVLIIFGILLGFFRRLFVKVLVTLIVEVALFILFPGLLDALVRLVDYVRRSLS